MTDGELNEALIYRQALSVCKVEDVPQELSRRTASRDDVVPFLNAHPDDWDALTIRQYVDAGDLVGVFND